MPKGVYDRSHRIYNCKRKSIVYEIDNNTCFNVTSHGLDKDGYPQIWQNYLQRSISIHRYIWEVCFGWIPEGMFICHKCDNVKCINPEHLYLGTCQDNTNDRMIRGRSANRKGEKNLSSKLTKEQVLHIRNTKQIQKNIAKIYNVSEGTISMIMNKKIWKHI